MSSGAAGQTRKQPSVVPSPINRLRDSHLDNHIPCRDGHHPTPIRRSSAKSALAFVLFIRVIRVSPWLTSVFSVLSVFSVVNFAFSRNGNLTQNFAEFSCNSSSPFATLIVCELMSRTRQRGAQSPASIDRYRGEVP